MTIEEKIIYAIIQGGYTIPRLPDGVSYEETEKKVADAILSLIRETIARTRPDEVLTNHAFQSDTDRAGGRGYNEAIQKWTDALKAQGLWKEKKV